MPESNTTDTDKQLGEVRHPIDVEKLSKYLSSQNSEVFTLPISVKQFGYGQSNPSYQLTDGKGRKYVLRKQPPGKLLAKSAHRVDREFAMLKALSNTDVPVPKVYLLCQDKDVLGTDFYVMEFLRGRIFHSPSFPGLNGTDRRAAWKSSIENLAKLHSVDPGKIGLPEAFTRNMSSHYPRQLVTLAKVTKAQGQTTDPKTGETLGDIDRIDDIIDWMRANMPSERISIVHGDFKVDNLVFHPTEPKVIGILDWELCTIGHPLADLANILQPYSVAEHTEIPRGAFHLDKSLPGLPTLEDHLQDYAAASGYNPVNDWRFGVVYAHIRLAMILQGVAARVLRGQASSAEAKSVGSMYAAFGMFALDEIRRSKDSKL